MQAFAAGHADPDKRHPGILVIRTPHQPKSETSPPNNKKTQQATPTTNQGLCALPFLFLLSSFFFFFLLLLVSFLLLSPFPFPFPPLWLVDR